MSPLLLTRMRAAGVAAMALPLFVAGFPIYAGDAHAGRLESERLAIFLLTGSLAVSLTSTAQARAWQDERRSSFRKN